MRLTLIDQIENTFANSHELYMVRHNPQQSKKLSHRLLRANYGEVDLGLANDALFNVIEGWKAGEISVPVQ